VTNKKTAQVWGYSVHSALSLISWSICHIWIAFCSWPQHTLHDTAFHIPETWSSHPFAQMPQWTVHNPQYVFSSVFERDWTGQPSSVGARRGFSGTGPQRSPFV